MYELTARFVDIDTCTCIDAKHNDRRIKRRRQTYRRTDIDRQTHAPEGDAGQLSTASDGSVPTGVPRSGSGFLAVRPTICAGMGTCLHACECACVYMHLQTYV